MAAVAIPAAALIRGDESRGPLSMLFLIPGAFIAAYSYFSWHSSGEFLNVRYLLPALPFTSILVAYAWRELNRDLSNRWSVPRLIVVAATALIFSLLMLLAHTTGEETKSLAIQEMMFRAIPLTFFAVGLGLILILLISREKIWSGSRGVVSLLLMAAFVWSGLTAFENDYLRAYLLRAKRADLTDQLARVVEPDSIIFTNTQNSFYRLWVDRRVRIAVPWFDDFKDFQALRGYHAEQGRATYVWLNEGMKAADKEHRLFDNLETAQILDLPGRGSLVQIVERAGPDAALTSTSD